MLGCRGNHLIGRLKAQTTSTKTPVVKLKLKIDLKINFDALKAYKEAKHDKSSHGRLNRARFFRVMTVCSSTINKF
jgi:hypothetical protein